MCHPPNPTVVSQGLVVTVTLTLNPSSGPDVTEYQVIKTLINCCQQLATAMPASFTLSDACKSLCGHYLSDYNFLV